MAVVLIIEDESGIRTLARDVLTESGHDVYTAEDGVAGLSMFKFCSPDIVVVDIIMPNKGGIEAIQEIRARHPKIPIIAMSGGGRTKNLDLLKVAKKLGADRVLTKPFHIEALVTGVAECLSQ